MSLYTVIALALSLKKITRKASKKSFKTKKSQDMKSQHNEDNTRRLDKTSSISIPQQSLPATLQSSLDDIIYSIKDLDVAKTVNQVSSSAGSDVVIIRDFAYPKDSPLHFGQSLPTNQSNISLSSPDFTGRDARAMFDFVPETENEIEMKAGQLIWVQYRQCPGWLIADVEDQTGLVPESYVEFI